MATQFAARVDDDQARMFRELTKELGTTPADSIRIFIAAFNSSGGFPFDVRKREQTVEPFESEEDALNFATNLSMETAYEAR